MSIFEKTAQDEVRFQAFLERVEKLQADLTPFADCVDLNRLAQVGTDFRAKTENFYSQDRKLNIGVIGQVKAGKSSFLNTLLFEGRPVLPSAATPKTATLTKIEYGPENCLEVEYYTPEEWRSLEDRARASGGQETAAKEIMKMVREQGLRPEDFTAKGTEVFRFGTAGELMAQMNDYVGENGRCTALVKNVTVRMDRPELREICVIDTPGLNDAIASRTVRTREFIKNCDVVFFLSRASQFLDENDMQLLTSQLPQEGVKRLVLLCSRFDDGLADTIEDEDSLEEAIASTQENLTQHARRLMDKPGLPERVRVLEPCRKPVFISSLCWNASKKNPGDYNSQERLAIENINCYGDVDQEMLRRIGNMDTVQREFQAVVAKKDETLSEVARDFLPDAEAKLRAVLGDLRKEAEHKRKLLQDGGLTRLAAEKRAMEQQIHGIQGSVEEVLGEVLVKLDRKKLETVQRLREASLECGQLREHVGTETKERSYWVSDFKLWNPFSWFSGHYHTEPYEVKYQYLAAGDALENIRTFGASACTSMEQIFAEAVKIPEIKQRLLRAITDNLDASSAQYDAGYFRLITEQTLNKMKITRMHFDVSREQEEISGKFSGEVKSREDQEELRRTMYRLSGALLDSVTAQLDRETERFRGEIEAMKETFCRQLLKNIQADFAQLEQKFAHKEQEIHTYEDLLKLLTVISGG